MKDDSDNDDNTSHNNTSISIRGTLITHLFTRNPNFKLISLKLRQGP